MNDSDGKTGLSLHVITGASKYTQIKTKRNIRIENREEPVAEYNCNCDCRKQLRGQLHLVD